MTLSAFDAGMPVAPPRPSSRAALRSVGRPQPTSGRARLLAAPFARRTWLATSYALLGGISAPVAAVGVLVMLVLSLLASVTVVGAVLGLAGTLAAVRGLARAERARAAAFCGIAVPDPHQPVDGAWWERVGIRVSRAATWREVACLLLLGPVSLLGAGVVAAAWTGALVLILLPLYNPALRNGGAHIAAFVVRGGPAVGGAAAAGIGLALLAPWVARSVAATEVRLVAAMLGPSAAERLAGRVDQLRQRREQVVDVAEAERRRIERDLHDGAQQRLVALAINLGMAKEKFERDPVAARALLEDAHREAKAAMAELRNLARGIHPAVLSDRGLDAALSSLAGRAPVPVEVVVTLPGRPPAPVETAAYFVVAEALTNIAKHARASRANVTVSAADGRLVVEIRDDGVGGADLNRGTGLSGLADRVTAVDGSLCIDSPPGGPTLLRVELPCAS